MTSDTTWTLAGFALGAFLLGLCSVAVLLEHREVCAARRKAQWDARPRQRCERCGDPGVLHMDTHLHLAHGERPLGAEDREDWR